MTEVDEQNFKTMDGCHICGEKDTDKDVRVKTIATSLENSGAQLTESVS